MKENNTLCACVVLNSDYNMGYVDVPWNGLDIIDTEYCCYGEKINGDYI
ncbi:hypothetical protein [Blautia sp.]